MNTEPSRAPLVTTSPEEAANLMLSEGGPVRSPAPESSSHNLASCCSWADLRATVDRHPLSTLAVAFTVGFVAGVCTHLE